MQKALIAVLVGLALAAPTEAAERRSGKVAREFQRLHPCPSTGLAKGPCPGWEKEHKDALCAGGEDEVYSLMWMRKEEHLAKSKLDWAYCRVLRKTSIPAK